MSKTNQEDFNQQVFEFVKKYVMENEKRPHSGLFKNMLVQKLENLCCCKMELSFDFCILI